MKLLFSTALAVVLLNASLVLGQDFVAHGYIYSDGVFTSIAYPHSGNDEALGVNDLGQVVGVSNAGGYLYQGGVFTKIAVGPYGQVGTQPFGINNSGQIAGYYDTTNQGRSGFLDSGGVITTIDYPGALDTWVFGLNNGGEMVGHYDTASSLADRGSSRERALAKNG